MNDFEPLDDNRKTLEKRINGISNLPDRLRHIVIDFILILILNGLLSNQLFKHSEFSALNYYVIQLGLLLLIYFAYYIFLEYQFGYTLGKWLNKTRVMTDTYEKPDFKAVVIRAIIRLIPFQFIMQLFPINRTLHDYLSKTWVMRIK